MPATMSLTDLVLISILNSQWYYDNFQKLKLKVFIPHKPLRKYNILALLGWFLEWTEMVVPKLP